jgi:hypothetical protein
LPDIDDVMDAVWELFMADEERVGQIKGALKLLGVDPDDETILGIFRCGFFSGVGTVLHAQKGNTRKGRKQ